MGMSPRDGSSVMVFIAMIVIAIVALVAIVAGV
jgi:hypothetical protein